MMCWVTPSANPTYRTLAKSRSGSRGLLAVSRRLLCKRLPTGIFRFAEKTITDACSNLAFAVCSRKPLSPFKFDFIKFELDANQDIDFSVC
jgi:hypothetical protein